MHAPAAAARYGERVIVGIDETGDFRDGSRAWFAAALIRPSGYVAVEAALRGWERRTRRRLGLANEIKGAQIDAEAVAEFVADVVGAGDGRLIGRRSAGSRGVRRLHRNDVDQVLHSDEICRVAGVEAGTVGVRCRRDQ